ncbi:MAG: hypothetical protein WA324_18380 [Bryobacteraceae bacterium]
MEWVIFIILITIVGVLNFFDYQHTKSLTTEQRQQADEDMRNDPVSWWP